MAREIERKFLVTGNGWRSAATGCRLFRQAYIALTQAVTVRCRTIDDQAAFLTIKSGGTAVDRGEFEYPVPLDDARELMKLGGDHIIEKRRYLVPQGSLCWEVDVFAGALDGLVLAEIELADPDATITLPEWVGAEVTGDRRYYNVDLARGLP